MQTQTKRWLPIAGQQPKPPCAPSCRCWPRPGHFSPTEIELLYALELWVWMGPFANGTHEFEHCIRLMERLAFQVGGDRVGYVLSVPIGSGKLRGQDQRTTVLQALCKLACFSKEHDVFNFLIRVLSYGVCLYVGGMCPRGCTKGAIYWEFDPDGGKHCHHPGRCDRCWNPPNGTMWSFWLKGTSARCVGALLAAGMYPLHLNGPDEDRWWRWHARNQRRQWVLCAVTE